MLVGISASELLDEMNAFLKKRMLRIPLLYSTFYKWFWDYNSIPILFSLWEPLLSSTLFDIKCQWWWHPPGNRVLVQWLVNWKSRFFFFPCCFNRLALKMLKYWYFCLCMFIFHKHIECLLDTCQAQCSPLRTWTLSLPSLSRRETEETNKTKSSKSKAVGIFNNWEQKYWTGSDLAVIWIIWDPRSWSDLPKGTCLRVQMEVKGGCGPPTPC